MEFVRYLARKVVHVAVVVLGVATLLFFLSRFSGDPAVLFSPPEAPDEVVEATRERLGLDRSLFTQYVDALRGAVTLDFGTSYQNRTPAGGLVFERLLPSLKLVFPALVLAAVLALATGILGALHPSKLRGRAVMVVAFILDGIPYFVVALILILVFAVKLRVVPASGGATVSALVLPVTVLTILGFATLSRLVRGQLLEALAQSPVVFTRSTGAPPGRVLLDGLRLATPPLLAYLGIQFSFTFGSLLILEPIFNYDGIGGLLVDGVQNRDFPVVQATVFVIAVLVTVVNIAVDAVIRGLDPRLRSEVTA